MSFGQRISNLRKERELSQQEIAKKLFVTDKTISSWEHDRTEPSLEMIVKISELFECSAAFLIFGDIVKSDIETEIKIKLSKEEFERLVLIMENSAKVLSESEQKDTYYQPTYRNFINSDSITEWLRIGERGNKKILTYKNWHDVHCDEYEVEIDDIDKLNKIFNVLGLEKIALVNKIRKTYLYLDKYEVALDYVENLGHFIEIEVKKYDKKIAEEYDDLLKIAKKLGLNLDKIDRRGYPYYFIEKKD